MIRQFSSMFNSDLTPRVDEDELGKDTKNKKVQVDRDRADMPWNQGRDSPMFKNYS
jgi:hypothetical protein